MELRAPAVAVAVVAEDPISRAGVATQLRDAVGVRVAPAGAPSDVTLVVADTCTPGTLRAVRAARAGGCSGVVLVVSDLDDAGLLQAVEAGVCGVLRRADAGAERLVEAVEAAAAGHGCLPPDLLSRLLERVQRLQEHVLTPQGLTTSVLSRREADVLRLLAEGHGTADVARALNWSERTVKSVVHGVTTRLRLRNRVHAVAFAVREGLI